MIEINHWRTGAVVFRSETATTIREAVKESNLSGAELGGADLRGANLSEIKADLFAVLSAAPAEVDGLRLALTESRVDGSCYEGECACLLGTIASVKHCHYANIPNLKPDSNRPAERWFLAINPYCSVKHPIVAITLEWIDQWKKENAGKAATA